MKAPKIIAYYLPQYHPIPENDTWWGKGFTEWTNVTKAKPLFKYHEQPKLPSELGFYDLRVSETREQQAEMAKSAGVYGFCYWHYWFGNGKRLLERPFNEVLESGKPDFPFCLAWANESWKGFDHGLNGRNVLIEQIYPGLEDYKAHFFSLLSAFKDKRYIRIDDKPLFLIYKPMDFEVNEFIRIWRKLAKEHGLVDFFFVGLCTWADQKSIDSIFEVGVDAVNTIRMEDYKLHSFPRKKIIEKIKSKINAYRYRIPRIIDYGFASQYFSNQYDKSENIFPTIISGWDHSPRTGNKGLIMTDYTPDKFGKHVSEIFELLKSKNEKNQIVFLKSWNEWAEGNYIEPDLKYGNQFLIELKNRIDKFN